MRIRVARKVWLAPLKAHRRWHRKHPTWWHEHPLDVTPIKISRPRRRTMWKAQRYYIRYVVRVLKADPR